MKRFFSLCLLAGIAAFAAACVTTEMPPPSGGPGNHHGDDHHDEDVTPIPRVQWGLHGEGLGYGLDVVVGGTEYHAADGGEYVSARRVSRNSRDVPPGTVSAFEVLLPDGEIDLYWVEEGRPGTLVVYRKFYDAYDNRWSSERRLRSITY
jgi:hypothetical protein